MGFLSNYDDEDDSKAAEKECKKVSSDKDVQKACKKVVKDVLKKGKKPLDTCKDYDWCPATRARAFLRARRTAVDDCVCEDEPTSSPTNAPTRLTGSEPTGNPTSSPTNSPTLAPTDPLPDDECGECTGFLSNYKPWQSKAAEKECKKVSSDKDVQKACKKVVKDVLKKGKNAEDTCKAYDWCP